MVDWVGGPGNSSYTGSSGTDNLVGDSDVFLDFKGKNGKSKGADGKKAEGADVALGNDTINGGNGDDVIYGDLDGTPDGFVRNFTGKLGKGSTPSFDLNVIGRGRDTINGGDGADMVFGGVGNDTINVNQVGHGYGDVVNGGSGSAVFNFDMESGKGKNPPPPQNFKKTISDDNDTLNLMGTTSSTIGFRVIYDAGSGNEDGTIEWFIKGSGEIQGSLSFVDIENLVVPCLVRGTLVKVLGGYVPVEDIKSDDLVWTVDKGFQPVRWAGSRKCEGVGKFAPIRIAAGTFDNERDLWVSPQHRILVNSPEIKLICGEDEVLVPAKFLVNGTTVTEEELPQVEYYHLLFDDHEVVDAEGAMVESFYPGQMGIGAFEDGAREELLELFPELFDEDGTATFGDMARPVLSKREMSVVNLGNLTTS